MKKIIFLHGFGSSGATKTVDYLNKLWLMYKDKAEDVEALKQLCAEKKAEIMKGAENETIC